MSDRRDRPRGLVSRNGRGAFAAGFAHAEACDALASEARRRAVEGVLKPVYYKGKLVGFIREYSDTLLMFLMKAAMPEKYRDNVRAKSTTPNDLAERVAAGRARAAAAFRAAEAERRDAAPA